MVVAAEASTPTPTATVLLTPSETRTPGPTRTPGGVCPGDCDGTDTVAVNELVTGVSIALGSTAADACRAVDGNGDGRVSISELIAAVTSLLDGCS
jgi:hypothetical protein